MLELYKESIDISEIDIRLSKNVENIVNTFTNEEIVKAVDYIKEKIGYSIFYNELKSFLFNEAIDADFMLFDATLEKYINYYNLSKMLEIDNYKIGIYIGRYYYQNNIAEEAIKYYSDVFKPGFDLTNYNYYDQLVNYYELLKINPKDKIIELINKSPNFDNYDNDLINTYLLLIINLDKDTNEYIKYIKKAIELSRKLVRKYQENNKNRNSISDTDEERNLCELDTLKMEYYVNKKDYINAYDTYKELTEEIHKSDCMRYYHARDLFYNNMIKYMSEEYKEVKFLIDIRFTKLEIIDQFRVIDELLNREIILKNKNNKTFKFKVVNIYENDITIAPILPLLGEGGYIFTCYFEENNKKMLDVR